MPKVFGLIDANAFYCSCERAFSPALRGRPVVVLSNNDGCAIARTAEAKALGIRMGDPWHKIRLRPEIRAARVEWFSSNYALYGDMSRRMHQVLAAMFPQVEPYSIDEMFLDMDVPGCPAAMGRRAMEEVRRVTKLPSCVGIGPTKTIAKLANGLAKADASRGGLCDLRDEGERARLYERLPVGEVWGIGSRMAGKLERLGATTIARFLAMSPADVRGLLTVVGLRIQAELRGLSCLPLAMVAPARKGIAVTRSFGRPVRIWPEMREALAAHAARAGEKLRAEGLVAARMSVFLHTNPHARDEPWHSAQHGGRIEPTADARALIREAVRMGAPLWRDGHRYAKAGVFLDDLRDAQLEPRPLFPALDPGRSGRLMAAMDAVNARHGRGAVRPLSTGLERPWSTRAARVSPRCTTHIAELMVARVW